MGKNARTGIARLALGTALLLGAPAYGQVDIEKKRAERGDAGLAGEIEVAADWRDGNAEAVSFEVGGTVTWQDVGWGALLIVAGAYEAERDAEEQAANPDGSLLDEEARAFNDFLTHVRVHRVLTERCDVEAFVQGQYDDNVLLERRALAGGGLRFALVESDALNLTVGTSYMVEEEILDADQVAGDHETLNHRSSNYLRVRMAVSEHAELKLSAYAQPRLDQPDDYRVLANVSLAVEITDTLGLEMGINLRHDSDPPAVAEGTPALQPTDIEIGNSLTFSF